MKIVPAPWVVAEVTRLFNLAEASEHGGDDLEHDCARRLVSDLRMRDVYESSYLDRMLLPGGGWRHWFDIAKSTLPADIKQARQKLKDHAKAIDELSAHLESALGLLLEIDNIAAGEFGKPLAMRSPLALIDTAIEQISDGRQTDGSRSDLPVLFRTHVKPRLDALREFRVGKYMPTVLQLVDALSLTVSNYSHDLALNGAQSQDSEIAAALVSRQHSPLPEYVRSFDDAMKGLPGHRKFLMPPDLMAIQAAVALKLDIVDPKQVRSARLISLQK